LSEPKGQATSLHPEADAKKVLIHNTMQCYVPGMATLPDNWKTQIRKGYLELCILELIRSRKRMYGFEILELLSQMQLDVKEGTLYPLLNRMGADGQLAAEWETPASKGHPRKFYSLTREGSRLVQEMSSEFNQMVKVYRNIAKDTER
jgi:PadR family transcriptional regulator PadR